jgi:hypothetical protein
MGRLSETIFDQPHSWQHEFSPERGVYRRPVLDVPVRLTAKIKAYPGDRMELVCRSTDLQRVINASDPWVRPRGKREAGGEVKPDDLARSSKRARQAVRDVCMSMEADRMATFSTRVAISFDALCVRWHRFVQAYTRHVKRTLPKEEAASFRFLYCGVPELHTGQQWEKKGLVDIALVSEFHYHLHVATSGLFHLGIANAIWYALCAADNLDHSVNGSIHIKRFTARKPTDDVVSILAGYISKYLGKEMAASFNRKSYWAARGLRAEVHQVILDAERKGDEWFDVQCELSQRYGINWTSILMTHEGCFFGLPDGEGFWLKVLASQHRHVPF